MAYKLEPQPGDRRSSGASGSVGDDELSFRLSSEPVLENGNAADPNAAAEGDDALPSSYGTETLYLMARDPHSFFAYWDVDWAEVFREQKPRDRKVHLRVSRSDGALETTLEVEPLAGNCYIEVTAGNEEYTGEIGYYEPADIWNSVAISVPVATPPDSIEQAEAPDFATVPFHLSFQRMIDLFRVSKHENASLTAMLSDLRERATSDVSGSAITDEEREIVRAIDEAAGRSGAEISAGEAPDVWVQHNLEQILGFGHTGSSPAGGFGGSSRPA